MRQSEEWRYHDRHGFMLRTPPKDGWCYVVTALCQDTAEYQNDAALWERHLSRLRVNAGCGGVCGAEMREKDVNSDFRVVPKNQVPAHIQKAFKSIL